MGPLVNSSLVPAWIPVCRKRMLGAMLGKSRARLGFGEMRIPWTCLVALSAVFSVAACSPEPDSPQGHEAGGASAGGMSGVGGASAGASGSSGAAGSAGIGGVGGKSAAGGLQHQYPLPGSTKPERIKYK